MLPSLTIAVTFPLSNNWKAIVSLSINSNGTINAERSTRFSVPSSRVITNCWVVSSKSKLTASFSSIVSIVAVDPLKYVIVNTPFARLNSSFLINPCASILSNLDVSNVITRLSITSIDLSIWFKLRSFNGVLSLGLFSQLILLCAFCIAILCHLLYFTCYLFSNL